MNFIPMNILEYRFNDDGITKQIIVAFQSYQGSETFNARVSLDQEFVSGINSNLEIDRLSKAQIEQYARIKLRGWILTPRPEELEEPPGEEGVEAGESEA